MPTYAVEPVMPPRLRSLPSPYLSLDVKEAPVCCNGLRDLQPATERMSALPVSQLIATKSPMRAAQTSKARPM
jgi:hypothetical protein